MTVPERLSQRALDVLDTLAVRCAELDACRVALEAAVTELVGSFTRGGRLYLRGNGGSHADSLHIAGELVKSYATSRPVPDTAHWVAWRRPSGR